jgi:hypothetical protein
VAARDLKGIVKETGQTDGSDISRTRAFILANVTGNETFHVSLENNVKTGSCGKATLKLEVVLAASQSEEFQLSATFLLCRAVIMRQKAETPRR